MFQAPEVWAGVECTVNRVGHKYFDQVERTGHSIRLEDLSRLADLGVRSVRYPILWERTAPETPERLDWSWADERLNRLRSLGVAPIVGLVHHGSGPAYTSLLDPAFPELLASYARKVAQRYPWVTDYTPINEPLTTARFSCLYGHWYPHTRDPLQFARALLNECRAIVLVMQAIRSVNSEARLIQTEDLGKTFSTPLLNYQAEFENERRWLTYDLLSGRLVPQSPMWKYFCWLGIESDELKWFLDNPVAPDILGVNHYMTSERFLDERLTRYPPEFQGGNGKHAYADVEAVRVCQEGVSGPKSILREVWQRYGLPLAITEVHLGCTREEQLRWVNEVWTGATKLRAEGVDVRAVTLWGAFGAFDWNNLLTRETDHYEPGLFDLRAPAPRPTALARFTKRLSNGKSLDHPVLDSPGWWRRSDRLCYPSVSRGSNVQGPAPLSPHARPILITGATGTLGQAFARICEKRGLAYVLLSRQQMDIAQTASIKSALENYHPWALINAAGYVNVDKAEVEIARCYTENSFGPEYLAKQCASHQIKFVTFSSDLVFDGEKGRKYVESDVPAPLNVYGRSKLDAEQRVLHHLHESLVVRTSAFFGPWDNYNFARTVLNALQKGETVYAADDAVISPTYVPDLVNAVLDLMIDDESGLWHIANEGSVTWYEFARMIANRAGYDQSRIVGQPLTSFRLPAVRPAFSALTSERGHVVRPLESGLDQFFNEATLASDSLAATA